MSFWGKLGKFALKAAPIAAAFIPGVGPIASAAIGGATSGLSKKLEGGSWKDSLISGGIGAGTGYGMSKLATGLKAKFGKGLSPSKLPNEFINPEFAPDVAKMGVSTGKKIAMSAMGALPMLGAIPSGGNMNQSQGGIGPSGGDTGMADYLRMGQMEGQQRNANLGNRIGMNPYMMNMSGGGGGIGPSPTMQNQRRRLQPQASY